MKQESGSLLGYLTAIYFYQNRFNGLTFSIKHELTRNIGCSVQQLLRGTHTPVKRPFFWDYPDEPVPER